jgi:predicted DNA-binding transcriptional regulator YafY
MKTAARPQYHRLQRILQMIREGTRAGSLPNCGHFTRELAVSRRTVMRDLDFLRDDHHAPIAYDDSRKGFKLTDPTFKLAAVELTRREVFSFSFARKLLERFEGTPLELDMRSVLAKIADSLRGTVSLGVESLTDQLTVLAEDHARIEPGVWQTAGRAINQRERLRLRYQRFDGDIRDYLLEPYHLAACQSKALGWTAGSLMMPLPSRMVWSRLVNCLPRAAVLIQRLSWQIWMASSFRSTP